jgi:hypothetical protein
VSGAEQVSIAKRARAVEVGRAQASTTKMSIQWLPEGAGSPGGLQVAAALLRKVGAEV